MKYETPELEITRFGLEKDIMADSLGNAGSDDGNVLPTGMNESLPEPSSAVIPGWDD